MIEALCVNLHKEGLMVGGDFIQLEEKSAWGCQHCILRGSADGEIEDNYGDNYHYVFIINYINLPKNIPHSIPFYP